MYTLRTAARPLAVGSAVLVATLALPASSAGAAQPPGLDHLKCYSIKVARASTHVTKVKLVGPFGSSSAQVAPQPDRLCNPVQKTLPTGEVTKITYKNNHLVCYPVKDSLAGSREVLAENQFGRAQLTVGLAQRLCLPSFKAFSNSFPDAQAPKNIDHFVCYGATYSKASDLRFTIPAVVGLADQFEDVRAKILDPVSLCSPVTKILPNGTKYAPKNPRANLVCFTIRQDPAHVSKSVFTKNQFGKTAMSTVDSTELCLPSFAKVVKQR